MQICKNELAASQAAEDRPMHPLETVLRDLRKQGHSRVDSIKHLRQSYGLSLGEAKSIVHHSEAWQDCREDAEMLQDALERLLSQSNDKAGE